MLVLLASSGNHTAVRGLVCGSLATRYARLTLHMPAPWPVHSACWIYVTLAQVTTPQSADWYGSLACHLSLRLLSPFFALVTFLCGSAVGDQIHGRGLTPGDLLLIGRAGTHAWGGGPSGSSSLPAACRSHRPLRRDVCLFCVRLRTHVCVAPPNLCHKFVGPVRP